MVYAENIDKNIGNNPLSFHAERHLKYKVENNPKFPLNIRDEYDYLVVRYSKNGVLGESRPCYHCIKALQGWNIKIKYVYYSRSTNVDGNNVIHRENLDDMLDNKEIHYCSGVRRRYQVGNIKKRSA